MPVYDPGGGPPPRRPPPRRPTPYFPPGNADPGHHPYDPNNTGPGDSTTPVSPADPAQASPTPGVPAPPAQIDWDAIVRGDPEYIARLAALTRQRHDALVQFGDASGVPGADDATAAEAANNPYSVVALLRQQLGQNERNLTNAANAHGVLFSGTQAQNATNEANAGVQRSFDARQRLLSMLGGYTDQQNQAYYDVYNRVAANPPGSPVAAAPAAPAPVEPPPPAAPPASPIAPSLGPAHPGDVAAHLPSGFHPPPAPPPLSHLPSVHNGIKPVGPRPPRASSVLPRRYG